MKIKKILLFAAMSIVAAVISISCTKEREAIAVASPCSGINAKFSSDISQIMQSSCATAIGCHGAGSVNGPGQLTNYSQISAAAAQIKEAVVSRRMPLGSSLSETDINKIKCWVESGALNN